jgi:hypothetical protein
VLVALSATLRNVATMPEVTAVASPYGPRGSAQISRDGRIAYATVNRALLRLNDLIRRIEHANTYVLTPDGQRLAIFYTKLHNRLLRPLTVADQPQAPPALRQALAVIDHHVDDYITRARLKPAA